MIEVLTLTLLVAISWLAVDGADVLVQLLKVESDLPICFLSSHEVMSASSSRECMGLCIGDDLCLRYSYNTETKRCYVSNGNLLTTQTGAPVFRVVKKKGQYVGCYQDTTTREMCITAPQGMIVPSICIDYCGKEGYTFAGAQAAGQCWCSQSVGKYGKLDDSSCSRPCNGDANQTCGENWINSVYYSGA